MTSREQELAAALQATHERIDAACAAANRDRAEVTLIVVTKYFPSSDVEILHGLGVREMGENRHQEAQPKFQELSASVRADLRLHFIGQLQSNKAAAVAGYADIVQSVDRAKVAHALDRARAGEPPLDVTIQVDLDGADPGRGGAVPADVLAIADEMDALPGLRLRGLMAVAPPAEDPAVAFDRLAGLCADVRARYPHAHWMSAGMSGDLEQAVAAGATHLRVGSAILGSRPLHR